MSNLHIVTGYKGEPHVKAEDHGALNSAIFGSGEYVLKNGNQFAASVISNNQIRVLDGCIMMQGRHIRLNEGNYVDLPIENGTQGAYRNDLVVARYTKNATSGIEDCNLVVIKGKSVASNPTDPSCTNGNIITDHALINEMPLYRVPLNGLNVQALVPLFTLADADLSDLSAKQDNTSDLPAETSIANGDYFPFYDVSATANKKVTWSNIVAKIRTALFGTNNGVLKANGSGSVSVIAVDGTPTASSSNLVTSGGVKTYVDNGIKTYVTGNAATLDGNGKVNAEQASSRAYGMSGSFTLDLSHAGKFLWATTISNEAITITVPTDDTVAFPAHTEIEVCQGGDGTVTFVGANGVDIWSMDSSKTIAGRYGCVCLKKIDKNIWILAGALE